MSSQDPVLAIEGLAVSYRTARRDTVHAVRAASVTVAAGETVAVVGESGSGKSTLAHAALGLLPANATVTAGRIALAGVDVTRAPDGRWRTLRGRTVGLVPQDPGTALNPVRRIGAQVAEVLVRHGVEDRRTAPSAVLDLLDRVGIPDPERRARQYPHELSGGLRQRVLIAAAIAAEPRLIVADEPTSALDVLVQRRILDLLGELTSASGAGLLLVTHDLGVAAERADRIVVVDRGEIAEEGPAAELVARPRHPRTVVLVASAPGLTEEPPVPVPPRSPADLPDEHARLRGLVKEYRLPRGGDGPRTVRAVDGVDLTVRRGATQAVVGESGSGKSTVARLLLGLLRPTSGTVEIDGVDLASLRGRGLRALRRRVQFVHQNPYASLNPRLSVEQILTDPLTGHRIGDRAARRTRAAELADLVALPAELLRRRPAELSGGQRQRVAIARALAVGPGLLVLDEPVSALDVSVQAQILDLLRNLQAELGLTYLFISHDLAVVRQVAHRVAVLRDGRLVEEGDTAQIFADPRDPYTRALLAAVPGPVRSPAVQS